MAALLAILPLAQETPAEEGKNIVIAMLIVGCVFISVILLGELAERARHRRRRTNSL